MPALTPQPLLSLVRGELVGRDKRLDRLGKWLLDALLRVEVPASSTSLNFPRRECQRRLRDRSPARGEHLPPGLGRETAAAPTNHLQFGPQRRLERLLHVLRVLTDLLPLLPELGLPWISRHLAIVSFVEQQ